MPKNGMIIALMDEYKKSTVELNSILSKLPQNKFEHIADSETKDEDCKSIQTIVFHIILSGYTYANYINRLFGVERKKYNSKIDNPQNAISEIDVMLNFSEKALSNLLNKTNEEVEKYSITSSWGVVYDVEQLLEHAIVHILRHRRQIENYINTIS